MNCITYSVLDVSAKVHQIICIYFSTRYFIQCRLLDVIL